MLQSFPSFQEYYDFLHEFMSAVKQNYGEKILVQVNNLKLIQHCIMNGSSPFCHVKPEPEVYNFILSLKILQTTMLLSCWLNMVPLIWSSMMIYRYAICRMAILMKLLCSFLIIDPTIAGDSFCGACRAYCIP